MTDDRTKPPPGMMLDESNTVDPADPVTYEWCSGDFETPDEAIAAAWAFVDRLRAQGAAEERERLAKLLEDPHALPVIDGWREDIDEDKLADWLRAGGMDPSQ